MRAHTRLTLWFMPVVRLLCPNMAALLLRNVVGWPTRCMLLGQRRPLLTRFLRSCLLRGEKSFVTTEWATGTKWHPTLAWTLSGRTTGLGLLPLQRIQLVRTLLKMNIWLQIEWTSLDLVPKLPVSLLVLVGGSSSVSVSAVRQSSVTA